MKRLKIFLAMVLLVSLVPAASLAQEAHEGKVRNHARAFVWKGAAGRGYLGVHFVPMTPELRRYFGVAEDSGVLISRVEEASPAEAAGVLVGEVLTAVDSESVSGPELHRIIGGKKAGDLVSLELWREGSSRRVDVTIAERERRAMDLARYRFMPDIPDFEIPEHGVYLSGPDFHIDSESMGAFEDAMRALSDRFDSDELGMKLRRLEDLDLSEVHKRMQEVEERLRTLERELEEEGVKKEP